MLFKLLYAPSIKDTSQCCNSVVRIKLVLKFVSGYITRKYVNLIDLGNTEFLQETKLLRVYIATQESGR
jgi:hypothetical protein